MNNQRKRELKEAYRTSRPPMGVLSFRCAPTGESFLLASRNIPGDTNGDVQVELGSHASATGICWSFGGATVRRTSRWKCWKSSITATSRMIRRMTRRNWARGAIGASSGSTRASASVEVTDCVRLNERWPGN